VTVRNPEAHRVLYKDPMPRRARKVGGMVIAAALLALAALAPAARAEPHILVVGDSLEELTSPFLPQFLPGVKLTVNAVGGSNSYEIFDFFEESWEPSDSVVVFDAGTNDDPEYPQILEGNLHKVAEIVGPSTCMVVPTIHGYTVNGVDNAGKNRVVREFAAARPGTQTPDWASAVHQHPELMQSDGLHPIEAGAQLRAELIAQGILGCLNGALTPTAAEVPGAETPAPGLGSTATVATAPPAEEAPTVEPRTLPEPRKMAAREVKVKRAAAKTALRASTIAALARGLFG
jgi:hypothetical protein